MGAQYDKPFRSLDEQVSILKRRGMDTGSPAEAKATLERIGYYRLSGYSYVFRSTDPVEVDTVTGRPVRLDEFEPGTTLGSVVRIMHFDKDVRSLLMSAIEVFEVALRARVGHILGRYDPFSHRVPQFLGESFTRTKLDEDGVETSDHQRWLANFDHESERSREQFVDHFRTNYDGVLPVWVATEVMSFGALALLVNGMRQADHQRLAIEFGFVGQDHMGDPGAFRGFLENIRVLRNKCAHHARVWNARMVAMTGVPHGVSELEHLSAEATRERVYASFALLAHVLAQLDPSDDWRARVRDVISSGLQRIGEPASRLGFPDDWDTLCLWDHHYIPSVDLAERVRRFAVLADLPSGLPSDLHDHLPEPGPGNKRGDMLRRLRQRGLVLGLQVGQAYRYPRFQFDQSQVGPVEHIAAVTKALFEQILGRPRRGVPSAELADASWAVAEWWTTPTLGQRPMDVLGAPDVSEVLREMLAVRGTAPAGDAGAGIASAMHPEVSSPS